jgi:hypothetical protein
VPGGNLDYDSGLLAGGPIEPRAPTINGPDERQCVIASHGYDWFVDVRKSGDTLLTSRAEMFRGYTLFTMTGHTNADVIQFFTVLRTVRVR